MTVNSSLLDINDPRRLRAMRACRAITKQRARNFYYGMRLTPEPKRSALYAIYAWMRLIDDLTDSDTSLDRRDALEAFMKKTDQALAGNWQELLDEPLWLALADSVSRFELDKTNLDEMLAGQLLDLRPVKVKTFSELEDYCRKVASTVGRICVKVWGIRDSCSWEETLRLAELRGIAFQLTNILRDLREDYQRGRIYMPAEDLQKHGLTMQELLDWKYPDRCEAFIKEQVVRAENYYHESRKLDEIIERDSLSSLKAMTDVYFHLLQKIARSPQRVVKGERMKLSALHKATIAAGAFLKLKSGSRDRN
ncbi:MAG TPA: phytoene/squalene synthase family protein [Phycisphaeraceae bacterium]|nr:phytoene/squalene synthase family protein [Phycisphaeraceae bacterium]